MEHKAGRTQADVWSTSSGIGALIDAGLIERFALDDASALGPEFRDPSGYWVATNMIVVGAAVNTGLVAAPERLQAPADLLAPKWRNQMVWKQNDITGAWGFIGNVLATMGEERGLAYLRKLNGQSIAPVGASTRAILDSVMGASMRWCWAYRHTTRRSAAKPAPRSPGGRSARLGRRRTRSGSPAAPRIPMRRGSWWISPCPRQARIPPGRLSAGAARCAAALGGDLAATRRLPGERAGARGAGAQSRPLERRVYGNFPLGRS